jgi:hypothetical protein
VIICIQNTKSRDDSSLNRSPTSLPLKFVSILATKEIKLLV